MISITREHEIHVAHRLVGYQGKCKYIHGHSYRIGITLRRNAQHALDDLGMVVDFFEVKRLLCGWLDDHWDHKLMLWDKDPLVKSGIGMFLSRNGSPDNCPWEEQDFLAVVPFNTTTENMAVHLRDNIFPQLLKANDLPVHIHSVTIYETSKSSALAD